MTTVGIRALKAKLSDYLRKAQAGEVVQVTDRGRVVAEIRSPAARRRLPPELAGLQRLIDAGLVSEALPNDPSLYRATGLRSPAGTAERVIDELREDR